MPARELDAGIGLGSVADEVAQAPHFLALGALNRVQYSLKGVPVAMDVGDDRHAHGRLESFG